MSGIRAGASIGSPDRSGFTLGHGLARCWPNQLGLLLLAGVTVGCACGCAGGPSAAYTLSIRADDSTRVVRVSLTLANVNRDSLVLRGHAAQELMRVSRLTAEGLDGTQLPVNFRLESDSAGESVIDVPVARVLGPLPRALRIRYDVTPGAAEGNSHVGFSGRRYGYLGRDLAAFAGRQVFLLPEPAERMRDIHVRFDLPAGWRAITPWPSRGDLWRPGFGGRLVPDHLITAAIGCGAFREERFQVGQTRYRICLPASVTKREAEQATTALRRAVEYIHKLAGRSLGPEYTILALSNSPLGEEIEGTAWSAGQGGSLLPLTPMRLQYVARNLLDAYLRYEPFRSEFRDPADFWLIEGIAQLYGWRSVIAAGLIEPGKVSEGLAAQCQRAMLTSGFERDLEQIYTLTGTEDVERRALAPYVLLQLDAELRRVSGGRDSLDRVARAALSRKSIASFSALLNPLPRPKWERFRLDVVRGGGELPAMMSSALTPTTRSPASRRGQPTRVLTIAFTGETHGYLENCGCKANQAGGLARRATVIAQLRRRDPNLVLLDAGSTFLRPEKVGVIDELARSEQGFYLEQQDALGYDAIALAETEISAGVEALKQQLGRVQTPYLSANVTSPAPLNWPAVRRLERGGVKIAILGMLEPPLSFESDPLFEQHATAHTITDPIAAVARQLPQLRSSADLIIVLGRLTPPTIRRLVEACPDLDIVISSSNMLPGTRTPDPPGFLSNTLVAYTAQQRYGLDLVSIGIGASGRVVSADFEQVRLGESIPDHPRVRDALAAFYDRVGRAEGAVASMTALFAGDSLRLHGRYAGADRCASCHQAEFAQWRSTPHAGAYKTLLERHRHFQPRCVACHVVGLGTPTGFRLGNPNERLANVQCEVCHGPGVEHVSAPSSGNIARLVPERVCLTCHNPEHSDRFVYAEKLPLVEHLPGSSTLIDASFAAARRPVPVAAHREMTPPSRR